MQDLNIFVIGAGIALLLIAWGAVYALSVASRDSIIPPELFDNYDRDSRPDWLNDILDDHHWWVGNVVSPYPGSYLGNDVSVLITSFDKGLVRCSIQHLATGEVHVGELSEEEFEAMARVQKLKQQL
jgi:hypothetical protein